MRIMYNERSDTLTIALSDTFVKRSIHIDEGTSLHVDDAGHYIYIQIKHASRRIDNPREAEFELITHATPPAAIIVIDHDDDDKQEQSSVDFVTVEEMSKMHGVTLNTLYRILRAEENTPQENRRIPYAFYEGEGNRREWLIPRKSAEEFRPDNRGRKK